MDTTSTQPEVLPYAALEERLRESEERFRGMFQEAPVACHEIDRDGAVGIPWDEAMRRIRGRTL